MIPVNHKLFVTKPIGPRITQPIPIPRIQSKGVSIERIGIENDVIGKAIMEAIPPPSLIPIIVEPIVSDPKLVDIDWEVLGDEDKST